MSLWPVCALFDGNISIVSSDYSASVCSDNDHSGQTIETIVSFGRTEKPSYQQNQPKYQKNLVTVKRNNKIVDASILPVVLNLNPRSLYNKQSEFRTLVEQTDCGVCCISET